MKKSLFFLALLALPTLAPTEEQPLMLRNQKSDLTIPLKKGYHTEGRKLVQDIWSLIKHHNWEMLKHKTADDFSGIGVLGFTINRNELITFLKSLHIQSATLDIQKVQHIGEKKLCVQYVVSLVEATASDVILPEAHMSIFEKEKGRWLWKSDANLSMFAFDTEE